MAEGRGRVQPLTIVIPVHRWWAWWLRLSFPLAERVWPVNAITKRALLGLKFIHFAHWALVSRIPRRGGRRLPVPYIFFHTNFNGDLQAYVDAFSIVVPGQLRLQLQGAWNFPGPSRLRPFRKFFLDRAMPEDHYWCAYPDASVKTVEAGLRLQRELPALRRAAREQGDEAFAETWQGFLREHGNRL